MIHRASRRRIRLAARRPRARGRAPVRRIPRPPDQPRAEIPSFARDVPAIRSGEPILRFNGKDFSGFYAYTRDRGATTPTRSSRSSTA